MKRQEYTIEEVHDDMCELLHLSQFIIYKGEKKKKLRKELKKMIDKIENDDFSCFDGDNDE